MAAVRHPRYRPRMARKLAIAAALIVTGWALAMVSARFEAAGFLIVPAVLATAGGAIFGQHVLGLKARWGLKVCALIVIGLTVVGPVVADTVFR